MYTNDKYNNDEYACRSYSTKLATRSSYEEESEYVVVGEVTKPWIALNVGS